MANLARAVPFAGLFAAEEARDAAPVSLLGIADATQSTFRNRCASAPRAIRAAYDGACYNGFSERLVDCSARVADLGDLLPSPEGFGKSAARYRDRVRAELDRGRVPFVIGGDHAITPAVVAAWDGKEPIQVVQWDAHPDMYPDFEGNRDSHACVAARLLELDQVAGITQIGIRAETSVQRAVRHASAARVRQIPAWKAARGDPLLDHLPEGAAVYLTFDMDGFDPAFAPAVAHPVPGGLSARAGLDLIHEVETRGLRLVGMDVVEACPDGADERTLILAARLLHEGIGAALSRDRRPQDSRC